MKKQRLLAVSALVVIVSLASVTLMVLAQDPVKLSPANHKVLLENERVRVYEVTMKPGEKLSMHSHPAHAVYFLDPSKAKFTTPDGKTTEAEARQGDVRWSEAVTHTTENTDTTTVHVVVMELKEGGK